MQPGRVAIAYGRDAAAVILPSATDSDLTHVATFTHLEGLELCGSDVTDSGVIQLAQCSELRYPGLKRTKVTPEGVKKLQEALPNCKINY